MRYKSMRFLVIVIGCLGSFFYFYYNYKHKNKININPTLLRDSENIIPVAIIGSGPAGLSAALYTARMNLHTVVFMGKEPGGQLMGTTDIENWPGVGIKSGPVLMKEIENHVVSFKAHLVPEVVTSIDATQWPFTLTLSDKTRVHALAVILATGSRPRTLNIEGEKEYWGRGVSTCAVCDAPFYKDRIVAVTGGGDSAAEQVLELASNAQKVYMIVRADHLRASAIMQDRLKELKNLEIRFKTHVKKIMGNEKHVTGIILSSDEQLAVDGFFLAIGHEPNSSLVKHFVKVDNVGYISLQDRTQKTSMPGIYAAGDVADHVYRQAGVASGDGIKAALDVVAFLRNNGISESLLHHYTEKFYYPSSLKRMKLLPVTTNADLDTLLEKDKRLILIDFFAPYCPSCMQMKPAIEAAAADFSESIVVVENDVSISQDLSQRFNVPLIPTIIVLKNGKVISRSTEVMSKPELEEYFKKLLAL